ncbi:MAG: peptidoglycan-binding domain-containing protein, partial [Nocardioidaceae bacterium]
AARLAGVNTAARGAGARDYRAAHDLGHGRTITRRVWMSLLSRGPKPLLKYGAAAPAVRRLQRVLNAADGAGLAVTGTFEGTTTAAVKRYQRDQHIPATGVVNARTWRLLAAAVR